MHDQALQQLVEEVIEQALVRLKDETPDEVRAGLLSRLGRLEGELKGAQPVEARVHLRELAATAMALSLIL